MKGVTILSVKGDSLAGDAMSGPPPLGKIVYSNTTFEDMCGRSSEKLLGSSLDVLIGPDSDPVQVSRLREAITGQIPDTLRLLCYHRYGGMDKAKHVNLTLGIRMVTYWLL